MIKPKRLRLHQNSQIWHRASPSWYLTHQWILGQKVKSQGHRVKKCTYLRRKNQNGWKYNDQTCHWDSASWYLAHQWILRQKVKVIGSKCIMLRRGSRAAPSRCSCVVTPGDGPAWPSRHRTVLFNVMSVRHQICTLLSAEPLVTGSGHQYDHINFRPS